MKRLIKMAFAKHAGDPSRAPEDGSILNIRS